MKLTIFNGSPRGVHSNSSILIDHFTKGFLQVEGNSSELHYLIQVNKLKQSVEAFIHAEIALFVFPLYTDIMPAVVKTFIEALEPYCAREGNPPVGFIIHSGFPEALQLRTLERYLEKLSRRLGCKYLGTVIKGGTEGIRFSTPDRVQPLFTLFQDLGKNFGQSGQFDQYIVKRLAQPERIPRWVSIIYNALSFLPALNKGWDDQLKRNNAYERRNARPYKI
jgi:NAD(P)H-dependent FMN reductase